MEAGRSNPTRIGVAGTPAHGSVAPDAEREISRRSRRSFLWALAAGASAVSGWKRIAGSPDDNGIPHALRRVLEWNRGLAEKFYRPQRLAATFPASAAGMPRANGTEGLTEDWDPSTWKLRVTGLHQQQTGASSGTRPELTLTLDDIRQLPRFEMVTELKCVEGWSQVVHWAGARLLDFATRYPPPARNGSAPDVHGHPEELVRYVGLETPDGGYYVGLDMASALHPQTLLCYEMNGAPLTAEHGAPLRLAIPVKYGIKNLKRIGSIHFTDRMPKDYWAERGYDWYAGH